MKWFWILLHIFAPLYAWAGSGCEEIDNCSYSSMWDGFSELRVKYSDSKTKKGAEFVYLVGERESIITFPTVQGTATIFSIPKVATSWHGIDKSGIKTGLDCIKDVRDTFAIVESYFVRAMFLVGFGIKGGPERVSGTVPIDISIPSDTRVQINPGDHMIIKGPWSLKGTVKKTDRIEFQLTHEFTGENKTEILIMSGSWKKDSVTMPLSDAQPLDDWLVCISGTYSQEDGKTQFLPAVEDTAHIKTVGDLRALISHPSGAAQKRVAP